ncbi:hypothetical protein C8P66_14113 [Humitalea rosea]|uniref:Nucleoside-diphosphate-sugar epimerase n=1 Tax=Humitalea rosea TaxID=990373 RepID=A0A2W7JS34_9PROT|nr:NAD(P)-dependent oxidoreductase [Humitalea rosea]PZW37736.1 hypothetical protein C8P66_14113 [Humitalea rosea]
MSAGDALIGCTGFVGSILAAQGGFEGLYNSRNIGDIRGRSFRRVICAGVSAKKWLANKEPEADRAGIAALMEPLRTVRAESFVLISTVDVFASSEGVDEATVPNRAGLHPYGLHRLELEDFILGQFPRVHILRLPALFGPGLRKNILFDLLNDNMVDAVNPDAAFQWYPVQRLHGDIAAAEAAGLQLSHLATEPLPTREILDAFFSDKVVGGKGAAPVYDLRTRHAEIFGGKGPYLMDRAQVLAEIGRFVAAERRR